ncbi:MAG: NAD(P)-dependent glycerol-3-phosphate dehydrogenase [Rhodospirillaceae bacterium]|nr:NAD(P)-dependent glycerol-3-phosphate dehydrogenase [Rhodospirillaceae bacterium]MBT5665584.1 NAD(P)-dependent glycerol-3-phosphate dehydrogenase [Rhodospirillaceae bacterium]MBT5811628.1 NAD(P)-dependent glycerol-3-phosphate dehydrogenase [Rhodospirillaceae bacterium]
MTGITIIGGGAFGTALACVARRNGADTILWARSESVVDSINRGVGNPDYLPGVALEPGIAATTDIDAAITGADAILLATPSQYLRGVVQSFTATLDPETPLIICAKGVERGANLLMSEVLAQVAPENPVAVLSGPTFAIEVARRLPTAVTLAARDADLAERLAAMIGSPIFRPYVSSDPIGAEICGAVKNVLAIACGILQGRQMGDNARAALITRGVAEIARLGAAKGAHPATVMGLSGLGDLTLTCNAMQSRNFSLGVALGEGQTLDDILQSRQSVAEGVTSAESVVALAGSMDVEMPICAAVNRIVTEGGDIDETIAGLLSRPFRAE